MRVKDLIKSQKMARKEFQSKIKKIKKEKINNVPLAELKSYKQEEIDKLRMEEAKRSVLYCKALTLINFNGEELSDAEKIQKFILLPSNVIIEMTEFLNKVQFGIDHEIEVFCQLCGTPKKRWLQQSLSPM